MIPDTPGLVATGRRIVDGFSRLTVPKLAKLTRDPWRIELFLRMPIAVEWREAVATIIPEATSGTVRRAEKEFWGDRRFHAETQDRCRATRGRAPLWNPFHLALYSIARLKRPRFVVETGVFDGLSSAALLLALSRNQHGELASVDLPAAETVRDSTHLMPETRLPDGRSPAWIVPEHLRGRHNLILGDSRVLLPKVLDGVHGMDLFVHDSLHTMHHQSFEYRTAWAGLAPGGLLLSDDVSWSPAFHRFCRSHSVPYVRFEGAGIVKKPDHHTP